MNLSLPLMKSKRHIEEIAMGSHLGATLLNVSMSF